MKCVLKDSLQRNCLHLVLIYNNQFATISFTGKWCSKQPKPFSSHQRKRANLQTIVAFLPISDSLYLTTKQPDSLKYLGCVFLGEFQNEFVISDHVDSSLNQKKLNPKKDHLPWQWHFLMLLVVKKSRDPRGEDKKEKQLKLCMNIQNVYISVWTQMSLEFTKFLGSSGVSGLILSLIGWPVMRDHSGRL